jgi:hypothetical protein
MRLEGLPSDESHTCSMAAAGQLELGWLGRTGFGKSGCMTFLAVAMDFTNEHLQAKYDACRASQDSLGLADQTLLWWM